MYKVILNYELGDYVKDKENKVYSILKIKVDIGFSTDEGQSVANVYLDLLDARELESDNIVTLLHSEVTSASDEEVDDYIFFDSDCEDLFEEDSSPYSDLNLNESREKSSELMKEFLGEDFDFNFPSKSFSSSVSPTKKHENVKNPPLSNKEMTNILLDKINDYDILLKLFGDESGKYKKKKEEAINQLSEL